MMIVGRIAWDKEDQYHTPWFEFTSRTAFNTWCRDMRKVLGFRAKSEFIHVGGPWTPETILEHAKQKEQQ